MLEYNGEKTNLYRRKSCPNQNGASHPAPHSPVGWHTPTPPAPLGCSPSPLGWVCSPPAPEGWESSPPPPAPGWESPSSCSCISLDQEMDIDHAKGYPDHVRVYPDQGRVYPDHGKVFPDQQRILSDDYRSRVAYKDYLHCSYSVGDQLHCTPDPAEAYYRYSTVKYSTVQYSTVQYNKVQYSTVQFGVSDYHHFTLDPVQFSP